MPIKIMDREEGNRWLMSIPRQLQEQKLFLLADKSLSPEDIVEEITRDTPIGRYIRSSGPGFLDFIVSQYDIGEYDIVKNHVRYWVMNMPRRMQITKCFYFCDIHLSPLDILNEIENNTDLGKKLYGTQKYLIKALGKLKEFR